MTSDVMFEVYGKNLKELLENAALAMFSVICDVDKIALLKSIDIQVSAPNEQSLLHEWLSKLLTQSEINEMFLGHFDVTEIKQNNKLKLVGIARGEEMNSAKGGTVVKGITYYGLKLEKTASGYVGRVALDI